MARSLNKVILIGNLGADPETRYMPSGSAVTNMRLATTDSWKDKETGDQQERTEWHNVAMFGRLAEIAAEIRRDLDFLKASDPNTPERQRSLRGLCRHGSGRCRSGATPG